MLGLTLWSINFFQSNHDLLGSIAFVLSLGFKQMALYYSPAMFVFPMMASVMRAELIPGPYQHDVDSLFSSESACILAGGRGELVNIMTATLVLTIVLLHSVSLLFNIGFVTIATFILVFSPFLFPPSLLFQSLHRIFPFARGLFEDKVANFWCALNIVIKLRDLASVPTLAKLALVTTLVAILPGIVGMLWISHEAGRRQRAIDSLRSKDVASAEQDEKVAPTLILLPHALFVSSMAFFLFSFQVHEKSILLPLMPLTLLMGGREAGFARMDWEWAVLMNNVAVFR